MSVTSNMRRVVNSAIFVGALMGAFYAHGESVLVGEPAFMDLSLPDNNECITRANLGVCHSGMSITPPGVDDLNLRVSHDGGPTEILTVEAYPSAVCKGGVCKGEGGTYYGTIQSQATHRYVILTGYYLHQTPDADEPSIYRRGTGPLAGDFPQYAVRASSTSVAPTAAPVSNVGGGDYPRCGAQYDTCMVNGVELPRGELPKYYNFLDTDVEEGPDHYCQMESCFNNNGDFIGLNPFYHEYR